MTGGNFTQAVDKFGPFDDPDTITLEHYRRTNGGHNPAPAAVKKVCLECGKPLKPAQVKARGRFCCHRCAGKFNARKEYGPTGKPPRPARTEEAPVGIVHDLVGDEFDVTTGERNDYQPPPTPAAVTDHQAFVLLGQALNNADSWRFEARLGDIQLVLSREAR